MDRKIESVGTRRDLGCKVVHHRHVTGEATEEGKRHDQTTQSATQELELWLIVPALFMFDGGHVYLLGQPNSTEYSASI